MRESAGGASNRSGFDRLAQRSRLALEVVARDGVRVTLGTVLERAAERMLAGTRPIQLSVRRDDVLAPRGPMTGLRSPGPTDSLTLNWITAPPTQHSGGMEVALRTIALLESRGHDCHLYVLYIGARRDIDVQREFLADRYPHLRAGVSLVEDGLRPADAVFSTAWATAYASRASTAPGVRFYQVCDFEPMFYPDGSNAVLAEETYKFGFQGLTLGPWLATKLERDYGMACDHYDFPVDLDTYRCDPGADRNGVVFYFRPDTARRASELGMLALELFAERHPEVDIHFIGQSVRWRRPTFRFIDHGHLSTSELSALYNRCSAGLVLSMTNMSLLPTELLAAGCVPVMNDAENTRMSCDSTMARFAAPTPEALAEELCAAIEQPLGAADRSEIAASVGQLSWDHVADQLETGIRRGLDRAYAAVAS